MSANCKKSCNFNFGGLVDNIPISGILSKEGYIFDKGKRMLAFPVFWQNTRVKTMMIQPDDKSIAYYDGLGRVG